MCFDWTNDLLSNQSVGTSTLRPAQHPTGLGNASVTVCDVITPTDWIMYFDMPHHWCSVLLCMVAYHHLFYTWCVKTEKEVCIVSSIGYCKHYAFL